MAYSKSLANPTPTNVVGIPSSDYDARINQQGDVFTAAAGAYIPKSKTANAEIYKEVFVKLTSNWKCRFTSTYRTNFEQDRLFNQVPRVTYAKGGESYHNYGLAVDICLINGSQASWDINTDYDKDGIRDWLEVVKVFESYNWVWGLKNAAGKHWDFPHFQKDYGFSIPQFSVSTQILFF